jgi:hypothetical protein
MGELERGRASYARHAWRDAHDALSAADRAAGLDGDDLRRLATSAYMLGREDEYLALLERAHGAHLEAGESARAVRCAFWIGVSFAQRGDMARAGGWLGSAKRLLEQHGMEELERGYLLLPSSTRPGASSSWPRGSPERPSPSPRGAATGTCSR